MTFSTKCVVCLFVLLCASALHPQERCLSETRGLDQVARERLSNITARVRALSEPRAKVEGLSAVAQVFCRCYKAHSQSLFLEAHEAVLASGNQAADLRWLLLPEIARCDPDLAFQLNPKHGLDADTTSLALPPDAAADIQSAFATKERDAASAWRFAGRALENGVSDEQLSQFLIFLMQFRKSDPSLADDLFRRTLLVLGREIRPSANRVLLVGNYVFTAPQIIEMVRRNPQFRDDGFVLMTVGNTTTYNIGANRVGIPPELVREFLHVALAIFSRPVAQRQEMERDFVALRQLLPKAAEFAPELSTAYVLLMERLAHHVARALNRDATYARLTADWVSSPDQILTELETNPSWPRRQELLLRLAFSQLGSKDFERVKMTARELEDAHLAESLIDLATFSEARSALEEGDSNTAVQIAQRLAPGLKRSVLYAGLGAVALEVREVEQAWNWCTLARRDAEYVNSKYRPHVLVAIAKLFSSFDVPASHDTLRQAVEVFNSQQPKPQGRTPIEESTAPWDQRNSANLQAESNEILFLGGRFSQVLESGRTRRYFSLNMKGVETLEFTPALYSNLVEDFDQTLAIVSDLADERTKSRALTSMARAFYDARMRKGVCPDAATKHSCDDPADMLR